MNNDTRVDGLALDHPKYLNGTPIFLDHSYLTHINLMASKSGAPLPFKNVHKIGPNNGERFLSKYLKEELKRNGMVSDEDKKKFSCTCIECRPELTTEATLMTMTEEEVEKRSEENEITIHNNQTMEELTLNRRLIVEERNRSLKEPPAPSAPPPDGASPLSTQQRKGRQFIAKWCVELPTPSRCDRYQNYVSRRVKNEKVRGRPPHSFWCVKYCVHHY